MMRLHAGFCALGFLAVAGCSLLNSPPDADPAFSMRLNGEEWEGDSRAVISAGDRLLVSGRRVIGDPEVDHQYEQNVVLLVPFAGPGSYPLRYETVGDSASGYWDRGASVYESFGDAGLAQYTATDDAANRMVVTSYDEESGVVEGTFTATLVVEPNPHPSRRLPDTLRVTDGYFRAPIERL